MGLALTTAISGVTGSWAITNETDSVTETVALPTTAGSPLHWVTLFENAIHTVGGPSFPLSRLDVTLLDGRLHFSTVDPSLEFSFAATPAFLQDNFFAATTVPNVDVSNPYTAPRANAFGWYGSRHALEDLRRPVLAEDVARPSSGGGVEVATLGSRTDRRLEIAYYGRFAAALVSAARDCDPHRRRPIFSAFPARCNIARRQVALFNYRSIFGVFFCHDAIVLAG